MQFFAGTQDVADINISPKATLLQIDASGNQKHKKHKNEHHERLSDPSYHSDSVLSIELRLPLEVPSLDLNWSIKV